MNNPIYHRIHTLTILIELSRVARQMLLAIIFVVYSLVTGSGGSGDFFGEGIAAIVGGLVLIPAVLRYLTFGYAVQDGNLYIKEGIVTKKQRTIPLDRIQNINLTRSWLHRILGLVDLDIETAVSAKAEARISALSEEDARVLRARLLGERPTHTSFVNEERAKDVVYKVTNKELFLAGASENKLGTIIGALLGLQIIGQRAIEKFVEDAVKAGRTPDMPQSNWLLWTVGIIIMLFIGWVFSIGSTFVKYYGFELVRAGDRLRRTYGMINHVENVLPTKRVQTMVFVENLLQRMLKICKVMVSTAGGFGGSDKQHTEPGGKVDVLPVLTPVLQIGAFPEIAQLIFPGKDLVGIARNPVGEKTVFRYIRSSILPSLIVAGGTAYFTRYWAIAIFFGLLGLATLNGFLHKKFAYWGDADGIWVSALGWLKRTKKFIPAEKVQAVIVRQSPAQRAFGLATVDMVSASPLFQNVEFDDVTTTDAKYLAEEAHRRSSDGRDSLVDGF